MSIQSRLAVLGQQAGRAATPDDVATRRRTWDGVLGPVLVLGVLAALRLPWLHAPLVTQDEGIILVYAQQLLDGRVPHRDFYTVYGPGTFVLTAGSFWVFGSSLLAERLVGFLLQSLVVAGVYRLALERGKGVAVGASVLSIMSLTPLGLVAFAWLGGLVCIVWGLVLLQGRRRISLAFAVLALSAVFRPEMAVPALACGLPFLNTWSRARSAVVGASVAMAPSVAFYATWGQRAFDNVVLQRALVNARLEFNGVTVVILGVAVATASVLIVTALKIRSPIATSWALLVLLLLPQLVQRTDLEHFAYIGAVAAPLAFMALSGGRASRPAVSLRRLTLIVAVTMLVAPSRLLAAPSPSVTYEVAARSISVEPGAESAVDELRRSVLASVPRGSRLFIGAQDMRLPSVTPVQLYFLLPELSADAYYLEMPIGISAAVGTRLADDVRNADVLVLVDFPAAHGRHLTPHVQSGPSEADDVVRAEFCPAEGSSPELRIMVKCAANR